MEKNKKIVAIIGLGGLGGYVAEGISRSKIDGIILVDGDSYSETNLNRQLFSSFENVGRKKAEIVGEEIRKHYLGELTVVSEFFNEKNSSFILDSVCLVVDALDNVSDRLLLERECKKRNLTLVHGAINGYYGELTTVQAGEGTLRKLYKESKLNVLPTESYVPAIVANLQVGEALRCLYGKPLYANGRVLICDLQLNDFRVMQL